VVNIGSMGGFQGSVKFSGLSHYSASKAALAVLTECLAVEYNQTGIAFNCLAIGSVSTGMLNEAFPGYDAPVKPEDMADFIYDFAVNGHRFMNGKILPVALSTP
ncbi:MAG TPA: SDR family oxidoreductase, partial [Bacteroidales bacterium]|nr:SDR family oxidoreductase [Bacteroidales bacterium]